ncbi:MAG: DNA cytosine methyltransferase [Cyanobacteria bacterium P01_A01_bin.83]
MTFNVLSLFGGIECGRVALNNRGITPDKYFSSEININSIKIASKNFPDIEHIGSVTGVKAKKLPKIDLILAGFPCTDLSRAGGQNGFYGIDSLEDYLYHKENNHKFQGQSYLFWEFVRLLGELQPKYFLLENVVMPTKYKRLITKTLQLRPYEINSSNFSAQSRERLYWTNIDIEVPIQISRLSVKDILDDTVDYGFLDEQFVPVVDRSSFNDYSDKIKGIGGLLPEGSGVNIDCSEYSNLNDFRTEKRVYSIHGKCPTMTTGNSTIFKIGDRFRTLTVLEKERLQGLPDGYTRVRGMADGPRFFGIGNGWTVSTIEHLLKNVV